MFAISLVLVVLISAAILLYQYWSGALAERERSTSAPTAPSRNSILRLATNSPRPRALPDSAHLDSQPPGQQCPAAIPPS